MGLEGKEEMEKKGSKMLTAVLATSLLLTLMAGTGFSVWLFADGTGKAEGSIDVSTTEVKEIGNFYANFSATSKEKDKTNKTNYFVVDETSIRFLYEFYLHLDFNDEIPASGTLSFTYDINISTIKVKLDETLFPPSEHGWPYDGYLSLAEMISVFLKPVDSDTWSKISSLYANTTGTNADGYPTQTISITNQIWKYSVDLASNQSLAGTSIVMGSSENIEIDYKTTYLEYDESHREEILKKARILLDNTMTAITYKVTYTS